MNNLDLKKRENKTSHWAKKERRAGLVPGVIYAKGMANLLFEVGELDLAREISITGEHGILNYSFDGNECQGVLKEVQRDPVTHKVIHVDLEVVSKDKEIQCDVPIQYIGEEWVNKRGGVLQKEQDLVKVSCKANDLPKSFKMDVSQAAVGSVFRFGDIECGEEISIIDDISGVIASISLEKKVVSEVMDEELKEDVKANE